VLQAKGDLDGALRNYWDSLAIIERLCAQDPANAGRQRDLSVSRERVGRVLEAKGDLEGALKRYRDSLSIRERLCAQDRTNAAWQRELSYSLYIVAGVLQAQGRFKEAAAEARKAEEVHSRAVQLAPHLQAEHKSWADLRDGTALLAGEREAESAADHLALGYALYQAKDYARSAEQFGTALEDASVRADLDRGNLYNAACSAALASAGVEGKEAADRRAKAFQWLKEDLDGRRELLKKIEAEAAGDVTLERKAQLEKARAAILAQFEHARAEDPELASLRGTAEFEALWK